VFVRPFVGLPPFLFCLLIAVQFVLPLVSWCHWMGRLLFSAPLCLFPPFLPNLGDFKTFVAPWLAAGAFPSCIYPHSPFGSPPTISPFQGFSTPPVHAYDLSRDVIRLNVPSAVKYSRPTLSEFRLFWSSAVAGKIIYLPLPVGTRSLPRLFFTPWCIVCQVVTLIQGPFDRTPGCLVGVTFFLLIFEGLRRLLVPASSFAHPRR